MKKAAIIITMLIVSFQAVYAQKDSIRFNNDDSMVGEIKKLNRNILTVETNYSDDDFTIEWDGVKEIYTETYFLITLSNGARYNGYLHSQKDGYVAIQTDYGADVNVKMNDIVLLEDIKPGFWSQLDASIDVGIDVAKANNLQQLSIQGNVGYMAKRWQWNVNYNFLQSRQDSTSQIKRTDGGTTFRYFLPHDWYPMISTEYLSNTEQQLKRRTTAKTGIGKYVIHTNKAYWGFSLGVNYNSELYTNNAEEDRNSWESFLGVELNLFNVGDLKLLTQIIAYPSLTESKRLRSDMKFDFKYDLPLDFYIKLGVTLNYDNQPATGSSKTDYILHSGFGWEW